MENIFDFIKTTLTHIENKRMMHKYYVIFVNDDYFTHYTYEEIGCLKKDWCEYYNYCRSSRNIDLMYNETESLCHFINKDDKVSFAWLSEEELIELKKDTIKKELIQELKSKENNNLKLIRNELSKDKGKLVRFCPDEDAGILLCAVSTDEDYYYVTVNNKDNRINFEYNTCCGGYEIVEDENNNNDMLEWFKCNRSSCVCYFRDFIENKFEVIITNMNFR